MKRANLMVAVGAVLVIGGLVVALTVGRHDGSGAAEIKVPVLVARADLAAGQAGDDLVASGKVGIDRVPRSEATAGALAATTDVAGTILSAPVRKGDQVSGGSVRPANLRSGSVTIPKGKQAVAVTVDFTSGAAGYAGPGDHVNIYTTIAPGRAGAKLAPFTKLLLSDVEVLDVSTEVAPLRAASGTTTASDPPPTSRSSSGQLTLLLALDAKHAETAIFASSFDDLWFTVLPKGQAASTTPGVSDQTYLAGS